MNPIQEAVDLAALEHYLDGDDESSYDSEDDDDSSSYSSDEDSVDGVADPILDTFKEKLMVHDLKRKARARRLRRRAVKKAATEAKEAKERSEQDPSETQEPSESDDSYVVGDDDSFHTNLKRNNSSCNLLVQEDSLEIEEDGAFDDFEDYFGENEEEVELELPLELTDHLARTEIRA